MCNIGVRRLPGDSLGFELQMISGPLQIGMRSCIVTDTGPFVVLWAPSGAKQIEFRGGLQNYIICGSCRWAVLSLRLRQTARIEVSPSVLVPPSLSQLVRHSHQSDVQRTAVAHRFTCCLRAQVASVPIRERNIGGALFVPPHSDCCYPFCMVAEII